jgi:hypothetical protein
VCVCMHLLSVCVCVCVCVRMHLLYICMHLLCVCVYVCLSQLATLNKKSDAVEIEKWLSLSELLIMFLCQCEREEERSILLIEESALH